jgi:hypothetical protein
MKAIFAKMKNSDDKQQKTDNILAFLLHMVTYIPYTHTFKYLFITFPLSSSSPTLFSYPSPSPTPTPTPTLTLPLPFENV